MKSKSIILGHPLYDLEAKDHQNTIERNIRSSRGATESNNFYTIGEELAGINFPLLPGTKTETQLIHQILQEKGIQSTLYQDKNALEEVIKAADNPYILHLATHGFFFENSSKISSDTTNQNTSMESIDLDFDLEKSGK